MLPLLARDAERLHRHPGLLRPPRLHPGQALAPRRRRLDDPGERQLGRQARRRDQDAQGDEGQGVQHARDVQVAERDQRASPALSSSSSKADSRSPGRVLDVGFAKRTSLSVGPATQPSTCNRVAFHRLPVDIPILVGPPRSEPRKLLPRGSPLRAIVGVTSTETPISSFLLLLHAQIRSTVCPAPACEYSDRPKPVSGSPLPIPASAIRAAQQADRGARRGWLKPADAG